MIRPNDIIAAFAEDQVGRLTGLTVGQLRYWDRTDFFKPSFADENRRVAHSRIYSFKDVVSLRILAVLRRQYGVPLQHLRKVAEKLAGLADEKWTRTTLYVLKRQVVFREPGQDRNLREIVSGQYVLPSVHLDTVVSDTRSAIADMRRRDQSKLGKIERSRHVAHNTAVIAGTRIPVSTIKRFSEAGYSVAQIIAEYPTLTEADVAAALNHRQGDIAA